MHKKGKEEKIKKIQRGVREVKGGCAGSKNEMGQRVFGPKGRTEWA